MGAGDILGTPWVGCGHPELSVGHFGMGSRGAIGDPWVGWGPLGGAIGQVGDTLGWVGAMGGNWGPSDSLGTFGDWLWPWGWGGDTQGWIGDPLSRVGDILGWGHVG